MELRREQRISVSLNATLLDETAMPLGCRVCDVTSRGMLLQYSYGGGSAALDFGDAVTVRLSLRQGSGRTVVVLPSTVRRVKADSVVVEFNQAQPSLLTLLEPYRILDEAGQQDTVSTKVVQSGAVAGDAPKRSYARVGKRGAETFARRSTHGSALRARVTASRPESAEVSRRPGRGDSALFYAGLAALIVAGALLVFDILDAVEIRDRLTALEATIRHREQTLSARPVPFRSVNGVQMDLKTLSERVERLAVSMAALESRVSVPATESTNVGQAQPVATASPPAASVTPQPAAKKPAAAAPSAAPPTERGPWVINLASSSSESGAQRFVSRAAGRDVPVEADKVTVKGKQMWRLQITGFATEQEARAYAAKAKKKLDLQDVWIFRR